MSAKTTADERKRRAKRDLPSKLCVICGREFAWRRKWARDWEQVKHCSDACRNGTPRGRVR